MLDEGDEEIQNSVEYLIFAAFMGVQTVNSSVASEHWTWKCHCAIYRSNKWTTSPHTGCTAVRCQTCTCKSFKVQTQYQRWFYLHKSLFKTKGKMDSVHLFKKLPEQTNNQSPSK